MSIPADTFAVPLRLYSGSTFMLAGANLLRARVNENTGYFPITIPGPGQCAGFGFMGRYVYTVDFFGTTQIYRYDLLNSTGGAWLNTPFDDPDDVACDGTYVYLSGADTSDGSTTYRVAKYTTDAGLVWLKNLGAYNGGAIHVAANPLGFMLVSNNACRIYDTGGNLVANRDSDIIDNIALQWASCATRDRFFVVDKTAASGGTIKIYEYNSATGARVQTITPSDLPADYTGWISATEEAVFYWINQAGGANHRVRIYARTVTRDGAGDITSDVIASTGTLVDLGYTTTEDIYKAATNANTYTDY